MIIGFWLFIFVEGALGKLDALTFFITLAGYILFRCKIHEFEQQIARLERQNDLLKADVVTWRNGYNQLLMAFREQRNNGYAHPKTTTPVWASVLGVAASASFEEVHSAYRKLAKRFHPDNRETGNTVKFQQINAAFQQAEKYFGRT